MADDSKPDEIEQAAQPPCGSSGLLAPAIPGWKAPLPWLPATLLLLGLALTAGLAESTRRLEVSSLQRSQTELLSRFGQAITAKLDADVALLAAVVGLFRASEEVDRREFKDFYETVASSATNLDGIQGLGFARKLSPGQIPAYTAAIRSEGFPEFSVQPPGPRPVMTAIEFLEPFDWRNRRAFGFDMWSEPVRREAMERAARTGRPSLSGRVELVQETSRDVQAGALIYLPIYRNNGQGLGLGAVEGWAYSPLRMGDLIRASKSSVGSAVMARSATWVYDTTAAGQSELLFTSTTGMAEAPSSPGPGASRMELPVAGRTWTVVLEPNLGPGPGQAQGLGLRFWLAVAIGVTASMGAALVAQILVSHQQATRRALELSEQAADERALASTVFEASSLGIVVSDPEGRILTANNAFTQLSGYRLVEIRGQRTNLLKSGKHDPAFYAEMWRELLERGFWEGDVWNKVRSGELRRHHLAISTVRDEQLMPHYYVGMLADITERHAADEAVRFQARHDLLTGLANRALLMEQLERDLVLARRHQLALGLLYIDLDGFKPVNDRYGHAIGDRVLQLVADRMRLVLRESDLLCRQGGDEFVVLISQAGSVQELLQLGSKLVNAIERPFDELMASDRDPCHQGLQVSASIGVARYPDHGQSADALLGAADNAMYVAKLQRGCVRAADVLPVMRPGISPADPDA